VKSVAATTTRLEHSEILAPTRHDINTVINDFLLQALGASIHWPRPMSVLNVVRKLNLEKVFLGHKQSFSCPKLSHLLRQQ